MDWHRCTHWEIQMKYLHPRWCKYKFKQMNKQESKARHLKTLFSQQRCKVPERDEHLTGQQQDANGFSYIEVDYIMILEHNSNQEGLFITDVARFYQTQDGAMSPQVGNRKVSSPPTPKSVAR